MLVSKESVISLIGSLLVRLYLLTLRVRIVDRANLAGRDAETPLLWAFWHNRMLFVPLIYRRICGRGKAVVLTSASRDGEMLAAFMRRFGFDAARGSSSRRGGRALLELVRWVRKGYDVGITPDGPRGPRYKLGPGIITLAQRTGAAIVPLSVNYGNFKALKSWDRFMIPMPFSRVDVLVGERFPVERELTDSGFEARRAQLESILNTARNDAP